jgi:hypothetical protein
MTNDTAEPAVAECRACGCAIRERSPGFWDNVDPTEWPCVGYAAHWPATGDDAKQDLMRRLLTAEVAFGKGEIDDRAYLALYDEARGTIGDNAVERLALLATGERWSLEEFLKAAEDPAAVLARVTGECRNCGGDYVDYATGGDYVRAERGTCGRCRAESQSPKELA